MKILKMLVDEPDVWFEITLEEALEFTEGRCYWKKGSVKEILESGQMIRTPWAFYKREKK